MSRLLGALAASLLALAARAQDDKKPADGEVDAKTRAAIQREVEKAKEDLRNEVRAEIQGAQSAAEFLGAVAEGPKLEFLQLDGYFRFRGQLYDRLDLRAGTDASGHTLFPVPLQGAGGRSTLASANMRLRLEPTLNVSEHVRVRAQIDVLDNYVLGSSTSRVFDDPGSPYPVPFYGSTRVLSSNDVRQDRPAVSPKRVWAEVQTPVGLLSFGRMPSQWGLGILANAGGGIDDDLGDTVDRVQFALPPVATPVGSLVFVPMLDFDAEGVLYTDPHYPAGTGLGQPFDAESGDDARTYALKAARIDTDDEVRRKLERGQPSFNYGGYYAYRTQRWTYPSWDVNGIAGTDYQNEATAVKRGAYGHYFDLWLRLLTPRWRVEAELAGLYGKIDNPSADPATPAPDLMLRQWGGTLVTEFKAIPNRLMLGGEIGVASGDDAPGFGNIPSRGVTPYGSVEGQQWGPNDRSIRNFRFNPAYRVDLVLWRNILGQVTDAAYLKPKLRWDIFPGLSFDGAIIYSRALEKKSTPSVNADGSGGDANLGVEADGILTYTSGDGFQAFAEWGVLQPLDGLSPPGQKALRGHFVGAGLAAKF